MYKNNASVVSQVSSFFTVHSKHIIREQHVLKLIIDISSNKLLYKLLYTSKAIK